MADRLIGWVTERRDRVEIDAALHAELARFDWRGQLMMRYRLVKVLQEEAPDLLTPDVEALLNSRKG